MNITIVYATYSNSTFMAAEHLAEQLKQAGHVPQIVQAKEVSADAISAADAVILASPSWDYHGQQGMPHEDFQDFAQTVSGLDLGEKPMAIMGLGDSTYQFFCGAVAHLEKQVTELNGKLVVTSLKIDQYYMQEAAATQAITDWAAQLASTLKE